MYCVTRLDFLKSHFKGPKYTIEKVFLPRRVKCGGTEGEKVVAHGCLKNFLRMSYEKFIRTAVDSFAGFSCERFLGISADSQERFLGISAKLLPGNVLISSY